MDTPNNIKEYYTGQTVLVTGGSGYLGKAIIEKILRSCPGVKRVYTLLRSKRGVNSDDRLEKLKASQIFDLIRARNPQTLDKFCCVAGDISEANLGLSEDDIEILKQHVNIVIHSAATVRFNEPIAVSLNINVLGTQRLLELCRDIVQLKNIVHVSTAYANPSREYVREMVYGSTKLLPLDWYIDCVGALPNDLAIEVLQSIHGFFPNTYTLTKYMAEQLVQNYRSKFQLPVSIVRPSIIGGSCAEPFPGWADNLNGVNACIVEFGRGTVGSVFASKDVLMDVVPLDIVFNCILVAAWFDALRPSKGIRVFNCTSGDRNGVTWNTGYQYIEKHCRNFPSKYTMFYPACRVGDTYSIHRFLEIVHTFLPAYLADIVLRLMGHDVSMVKIQEKFQAALISEFYFTTHQWQFEFGNMLEMLDASKSASDHGEFNFDISSLNWDTYTRDLVLGMQRFYLKVDMDDLPNARRKLKVLYAAWCLYYVSIFGVGVFVLYSIFAKFAL